MCIVQYLYLELWGNKRPPLKCEDCPCNCSEKPNNCETCKHYHPDHEAIACERCLDGKYSRYEPKTEPTTEDCSMVDKPKECCDCTKHICVGCEHQEAKEQWRKAQADCPWK